MHNNTRRRATWILALLALAGTMAVQAQEVPGSSPDVIRLAAARRVLEASGAIDVMVAAMRASLPAQRAAMPQLQQLPAEFWTRFEAQVVEDAPQLLDSIAVLYARTFSLEDLEALAGFYSSPAGQRLKELQPSLVTESSAIGRRWGARIGLKVGASLVQ